MPTQRSARRVPVLPTHQSRRETIGDLRRAGAMLEFVCNHCAVSRLFDPYLLPFGDQQFVATARRRMKCSFCGWQGDSSFTRTAGAYQAQRHPVLIGAR